MGYTNLTDNNIAKGYYEIGINCTTQPENTIEISKELWDRHRKVCKQQWNGAEWVDYIEPEEVQVEKQKNILFKRLVTFCNEKLQEIKSDLANRYITNEDEERYKYKYDLAISYKENGDETAKTYLEFELDITNTINETEVSLDEFVDDIINKHDEWIATLKQQSQRLEAFRRAISTLIEKATTLKDIELLQYKSQIAQDFNISTSDDEIKELILLEAIPEEE